MGREDWIWVRIFRISMGLEAITWTPPAAAPAIIPRTVETCPFSSASKSRKRSLLASLTAWTGKTPVMFTPIPLRVTWEIDRIRAHTYTIPDIPLSQQLLEMPERGFDRAYYFQPLVSMRMRVKSNFVLAWLFWSYRGDRRAMWPSSPKILLQEAFERMLPRSERGLGNILHEFHSHQSSVTFQYLLREDIFPFLSEIKWKTQMFDSDEITAEIAWPPLLFRSSQPRKWIDKMG